MPQMKREYGRMALVIDTLNSVMMSGMAVV